MQVTTISFATIFQEIAIDQDFIFSFFSFFCYILLRCNTNYYAALNVIKTEE